MPAYTVLVRGDARHRRQTFRFVADRPPGIGETIAVDGVHVVVDAVLRSMGESGTGALIEARRARSDGIAARTVGRIGARAGASDDEAAPLSQSG